MVHLQPVCLTAGGNLCEIVPFCSQRSQVKMLSVQFFHLPLTPESGPDQRINSDLDATGVKDTATNP